MKKFIEVKHAGDMILVNVASIMFIKRGNTDPADRCYIVFRVGGENEQDAALLIEESYERIKAKINVAVN